LGSVVVNAARATVGGALLLGWVTATAGVGAFAAASTGALGLLALSIVTAIAIGDTVFFESTRALGLGRAMTISMTYPLGAAALAAAFLGEPGDVRRVRQVRRRGGLGGALVHGADVRDPPRAGLPRRAPVAHRAARRRRHHRRDRRAPALSTGRSKRVGVSAVRAPALPAQSILGGGIGRGAKPPAE